MNKEWMKKKYEKHYINYKQTKEFEQDFELAEKSWVELNEKIKIWMTVTIQIQEKSL